MVIKMKKMNNKGFAISSLLYGLLLVAFLVVAVLMSVMASNRKNTSTLINKIEEDLNRHSLTVTEFEYTDDVQEYIVPPGKAGWYKIELWGGAGAGTIGDTTDKRGSYVGGIVYLPENMHLYFYVGGAGIEGTTTYNQLNSTTAGGGGATDVRTLSAGKNGDVQTSKETIFMLAGGGAGGGRYAESSYNGGTDAGTSFISTYGGQRMEENLPILNSVMMHAVNGGSGKATIELVSQNPQNVLPAKKTNGLSNILEVRDCLTVSGFGASNEGRNGGNELWTEVQVYAEVTSSSLYSQNMTGVVKSDSGTFRGDALPDTIKNTSMAAISGKKTTAGITNGTQSCIIIQLGGTRRNIEEISLFHHITGGTQVLGEEISVRSNSGQAFSPIITYDANTLPTETTEGIRISARQLGRNEVPEGSHNYYLELSNGPGRLATATTSDDKRNITQLMFNEGAKKRKWTITKLADGKYKIVDAHDFLALQPSQTDSTGLAENGITVSTISQYTDEMWQKWNILHQPSGYHMIQYVKPNDQGEMLCMTAEYTTQNMPLKLLPCNASDKKQLWKLVTAEY